MTNKKRKVVNMNYPPEDMPIEEIERFWGKPGEEDRNLLDRINKIKVKGNKRNEPGSV